jgi:acyl-CoA thioester hydrolase
MLSLRQAGSSLRCSTCLQARLRCSVVALPTSARAWSPRDVTANRSALERSSASSLARGRLSRLAVRMPRVQVELPERILFATDIPIRIDDINYGGHLGNDAVLSIAHEARLRFLNAYGWTELDIDGAGILMVDAAVVYLAEGKHGMTLRVELGAADVRTRGCDLLYRLLDAATGREIARVKTGIVFLDRAARKLVTMPAALRAKLEPPAAP